MSDEFHTKLFRRHVGHYLRELADQVEAGEVGAMTLKMFVSPQDPVMEGFMSTADGQEHRVVLQVTDQRWQRKAED